MADFRAPTRGAPTLWRGRPARDPHGQGGRATIWLRLRRAALPDSAAMRGKDSGSVSFHKLTGAGAEPHFKLCGFFGHA
jgi:hypothetical protein